MVRLPDGAALNLDADPQRKKVSLTAGGARVAEATMQRVKQRGEGGEVDG